MVARLARQWIKRTKMNSFNAKCCAYLCGGSFGSAVSKRAKRASSFGDVCKWPCIL